jgi:hypothetical protein
LSGDTTFFHRAFIRNAQGEGELASLLQIFDGRDLDNVSRTSFFKYVMACKPIL